MPTPDKDMLIQGMLSAHQIATGSVPAERSEPLASERSAQGLWQPIETAPRDSRRILVAYQSEIVGWLVKEAWWRMPWESAPADQCSWQTMDGLLLSADVHTAFKDGKPLGATHWMPLPAPPEVK